MERSPTPSATPAPRAPWAKRSGRNPFAIVVPCHRVVGANAKLIGFSANGGIATKLKMLMIEGWRANEPSLFEGLV